MSEQKTEQQQIEEMEKDIGKAVGLTYEGEHFVYTLHTQKYLAKALYDAGYRKQTDVVREFAKEMKSFIVQNCCVSDDDVDKIYKHIDKVAADFGAEV